MKIIDLKVGDLVVDGHGSIGAVRHFTRDHVTIEWGDGKDAMSARHTDAELQARGVVLVEGCR